MAQPRNIALEMAQKALNKIEKHEGECAERWEKTLEQITTIKERLHGTSERREEQINKIGSVVDRLHERSIVDDARREERQKMFDDNQKNVDSQIKRTTKIVTAVVGLVGAGVAALQYFV